ncbi:hypothetical protein [Algiphilus sp.]|uniref:hypothetical protein n=1 Tax=Algiphilus sp. TaxID=1872431 RepID=UPI003B528C9C
MNYPFNDITDAFGRMGKAALEPATLAGEKLISTTEAMAKANQAQAVGAMRAAHDAVPAFVNADSPKAAYEVFEQLGEKMNTLGQSYLDELTQLGNQQFGAAAAVAEQAMTAGSTIFSEGLDLVVGLTETVLSTVSGKVAEAQQAAA